jgi:hypothetical protein
MAELSEEPGACCASEQQATCCEPSDKAGCCGQDDGCGCDVEPNLLNPRTPCQHDPQTLYRKIRTFRDWCPAPRLAARRAGGKSPRTHGTGL